MKIEKRLLINSIEMKTSDENWVLELSAGGRGILTVEDKEQAIAVGQNIHYQLGSNGTLKPWFTGYITKATPNNIGFTRIVVRELCFLLSSSRPLSLQHATVKSILDKLSKDTGLSFTYNDNADYFNTPVANFTSNGSGYQVLENIGRAFQIPDFVWYQQADGVIFIGSHADSNYHNKPIIIPQELIQKQKGGNSVTLPLFPSIRPAVEVNGQRITKQEIKDDELTLFWSTGKQDSSDKQKIKQLFPELAAGFHLPKLGQVMAVTDSANSGDINTAFRPRYAADVQLLNENGEPEITVPVYKSVMLPIGFGGSEQGQFHAPNEGSIVELAFANGRADQPFIRTVLGLGWTLPNIEVGELLLQQREEVQERTDTVGNQWKITDQEQHDHAFAKTQKADVNNINSGQHRQSVKQHSTESITGQKVIESLGAIDVLAGDNLVLGALGNMQMASAGELVQVVGKLREVVIGLNDKLTVMGNRVLTIEKNDTIIINGQQTITISKDQLIQAKNINMKGDLITLNGGAGVITCESICPFTGKPHVDGSTTVFAGK